MQKNHQDPEFCAKQIESRRIHLQDKEYCMSIIKGLVTYSQSPEGREQHRQTMTLLNQEPEFSKARNERLIERNKTPESCERNRQLWLNPEYRKNVVDALTKESQSPEGRKRRSETMSKLHDDPEFRSKNAAGMGHGFTYTGPNGVIPMRSSWEVLFAQLLDFISFTWKYEPKQYLMSFEDITTPKYTPDFWVDELDCYIEVKGRDDLVELAEVRAEICQLLHNVKVIVLDGEKLELLGLWSKALLQKEALVEKLESFRIA